ncbi:MAG TPA: glycosyltransferase [Anaerolineales bacterium]|nr:glycosyltransferase [Anaerolineales bacterium]
MRDTPSIAIVIDALGSFTGAERVLAAILELYPEAALYTLAHDARAFVGRPIEKYIVHTSWVQRLPWGATRYRSYLPLLPLAVESLDLRGYDVVLSLSYAVAHGVLCRPDQIHISYTLAPLRYAWQSAHEYFQRGPATPVAGLIMHYMRIWDFQAAARVDHLAAISQWTADCVRRAYRREAEVIYPPVDIERFHPSPVRDDYYVAFSRLVRHKRLELVVEAFAQLGLPLVVIGEGPERQRLEALARNRVKLVGWKSDEEIASILGRARALIHAAEEDFGLVMAEAQAAGCPLIGYARGAAREIMVEQETGLLFGEQTVESIVDAVRRFESKTGGFPPAAAAQNALRFGKQRFQAEFAAMVDREASRGLNLEHRTSMAGT